MNSDVNDDPSNAENRRKLVTIASVLDDAFNGDGQPRRTGFVLVAFPLDSMQNRCEYISNGVPRHIGVRMLMETISQFEGQPADPPPGANRPAAG